MFTQFFAWKSTHRRYYLEPRSDQYWRSYRLVEAVAYKTSAPRHSTAYDVAVGDDRPTDLRCRVEYSWEIRASDQVSVLIWPSRCRRFETRRRCY